MKKIALVALVFSFVGFLFGFLIFGQTTQVPLKINEEVKSDVIVEPTKSAPPTEIPKTDLYQVSKVIDGDTISVNIDGKIETIRLIGIDSPESVDPRKPVQCFGKEASNKAKEILIGKKVGLEYDPTQGERDKYKRLLRYVFLENGTNFNKLMIELGYAHEYTYDTPYKYQTEFKLAEKTARENSKGLWADGACSAVQGPTSISTPIPAQAAAENTKNSGNFSCAGKTACGQMASCEEATFYLNNCGLGRLDGDKDGVPCETLCR